MRAYRRPRRRGAVMVWLVICLGVIIVIVALGTDGGRMMEERRRAQAAADAAALAAAADLYRNYRTNKGLDLGGSAARAALASAAINGYANDGSTSTVTVNIPPQSGPFAGRAEFVEVLIQSHMPGSFSAAFSSGDLAVRARALARGRPLPLGLMVLRPSGSSALALSGNATVQVKDASIIVNSNAAGAIAAGGTISASSVEVVGGVGAGGGILCPVHSGVDPTPDPLRTFPVPDRTTSPLRSSGEDEDEGGGTLSLSEGSVVLQPGTYRGGISLSGEASVRLEPGIYILDGGGLSLSDEASLSGNGVMIYNTGGASSGSISLSGQGSVNLTAPTSGVYQGISIFQDRSSTQTIRLSGTGSLQIAGAIYAAGAAVELSGNGGSGTNTAGGAFICNTLQLSGNGTFKIDQGSNRAQVPDVRLVE